MSSDRVVAVYGAYGHTGRFVVSELSRRGWTPILCGRDAGKLATLHRTFPQLAQRQAAIDDPLSLDRAFGGARAVINCAGPFLDTAAPVIEAALRARVHYLDVSAEQHAVLEVFDRFSMAALAASISVIPAMGFFGGLADVLASAALGDWPDAESVEIGVALDSWHPTVGTRLTGARNQYPRKVVRAGKLTLLGDSAAARGWDFPPPFGNQSVVAVPLSEIITIARHIRSDVVQSYMNLAPLADLHDEDTPPPLGTDELGRSDQRFVVDVHARRSGELRRVTASGRDIYAITAPLVVGAFARIVDGHVPAGVHAPGAVFDARGFLSTIEGLNVRFDT